jgi:hypothetical protein
MYIISCIIHTKVSWGSLQHKNTVLTKIQNVWRCRKDLSSYDSDYKDYCLLELWPNVFSQIGTNVSEETFDSIFKKMTGEELVSWGILKLEAAGFPTTEVRIYKLRRYIWEDNNFHIDCTKQDLGRAIAQAVSRWLATEATRVRPQLRSCKICGEKSGHGAGFLRIFRFPLQIRVSRIAGHLSSRYLAMIMYFWYALKLENVYRAVA